MTVGRIIMGKAFLVFLLMAVAAFFIYKQTSKPVSDEELKVKAVEERFLMASAKFMGTAGSGLASGLDVAESAVIQVQKIRNELARLRKSLTEDTALLRADELKGKIDEFCRKNDIE
ncbi:MAG: hypothetical protein ACXV5O_03525 [Candidatus Aminicenantales bacterium]